MNKMSGSPRTKLSLKDSLFLGFCALFIIIFRAAFRLHLNIPGHVMLFTVFFLMLARACVPHRLSAAFTGLAAGVLAMLLGVGKGGPLLLLKFLIPALAIDLGAWIAPRWYASRLACIGLAALAALAKFGGDCLIDFSTGMDPGVVFRHALLKSGAGILFAVFGAAFVPVTVRRLQAAGVIRPGEAAQERSVQEGGEET